VRICLGSWDPRLAPGGYRSKRERGWGYGLLVLRAKGSGKSGARSRPWQVKREGVVLDTGLSGSSETVVSWVASKGVPYVLVPYAR